MFKFWRWPPKGDSVRAMLDSKKVELLDGAKQYNITHYAVTKL